MSGSKRGYGMSEKEADARAINAEPWEPPPGMERRHCPHCRYFFAAASGSELAARCPDCMALGTRPPADRG